MAESRHRVRVERPVPNPESRIMGRWRRAESLGPMLLGLVCLLYLAPARGESAGTTNVSVEVKDAETDQPIYQARLTLQFREPGSKAHLKRSKMLAYSAKTNAQGRYRFVDIPKGTVRLIVTSEHHQAYSKEFEVNTDNQVLEVKLKKPQPLL